MTAGIEMRKVMQATVYAVKAHGLQTRKYTGEPYIVHPIAVANRIAKHGGTVNMVCAALLHDTIEDCDVQYDDLIRIFGMDVAQMVLDLTEREYPDHNRAGRKHMECTRLSRVSAPSQTIKVADLIDNTKSIVEEDKAFAPIYLAEKIALLKVLTKANPVLKTIACEQIMAAQAKLLEDVK